jgi:radical SAM superfamily enzyme YgiQ (UPF0313 family)
MPFGNIDKPAIGLSLLKAECERRGYTCDIQYANLLFAEIIGRQHYDRLLQTRKNDAFGEWLFTQEFFGDKALSLDDFLQEIKKSGTFVLEDVGEILTECREKIAKYMDLLMGRIVWRVYDIVGFSCCLQQNIASLAYARRIKDSNPDITIVFGGANVEAPMGSELMSQFSFIDIAVSGEGDSVFPRVVDQVRSGESLEGIDGVMFRKNGHHVQPSNPVAKVENLEDLPYPDFDDYFRMLRNVGLDKSVSPLLLFETSRGCWWGEKSQCAFCGLNNLGIKFRSKSAERVMTEMDYLIDKYGITEFHLCDCNLDRTYLSTLLPRMKERNKKWELRKAHGWVSHYPSRKAGETGPRLFFEVKANFKKKEVGILADAGVVLFPGIESLSTPILKLAKKGCTAPQNIQVLKWCCELGVVSLWNFLYGFPGEDPGEYVKMQAMIPKLIHLPPPTSFHPIILTRSSPYHRSPQSFGLKDIKPATIYHLLYPLPERSLERLAVYFDFQHGDGRRVEDYAMDLWARVEELWLAKNQVASLYYMDDGEVLKITDERSTALLPSIELRGIERELYIYCDAFKRRPLVEKFVLNKGYTFSNIEEFLDDMVANGFILGIDDGYLSLAIKPQREHLTPGVIRQLMEFVF